MGVSASKVLIGYFFNQIMYIIIYGPETIALALPVQGNGITIPIKVLCVRERNVPLVVCVS